MLKHEKHEIKLEQQKKFSEIFCDPIWQFRPPVKQLKSYQEEDKSLSAWNFFFQRFLIGDEKHLWDQYKQRTVYKQLSDALQALHFTQSGSVCRLNSPDERSLRIGVVEWEQEDNKAGFIPFIDFTKDVSVEKKFFLASDVFVANLFSFKMASLVKNKKIVIIGRWGMNFVLIFDAKFRWIWKILYLKFLCF